MTIENQSFLTSKYKIDEQEYEANNQSNITKTENLTILFSKVKTSSKSYGAPLETLTQKITLTNNSSYEISDIFFMDTMSIGAEYQAGSVKINNVIYENYEPGVGFDIPNMSPTDTTIIEYKIIIDENPTTNNITNSGKLTYKANALSFIESTNEVSIEILNNKIELIKTADKSVAASKDRVLYTTVITNNGQIKNTNLLFKDPIPDGTTFVEKSVKIDGVSYETYNPTTGFNIQDLDVNESVRITFEVLVN